ncbi:MAG: SDR family oxidoreductase [Bryobacterales bacterium]|nr:SDR family oxidoreductase [Bryobacterales bacterium]
MRLEGKNVIITGAGHGIGRGLAVRFAAEGARLTVADIDQTALTETARLCGGFAVATDVAVESSVRELVRRATGQWGPVDLFCSNAGIFLPGGLETPDADWERVLSVNFRAHLYAARAVLPAMIERGEGYLLQVVSAAGLLTQIGSATYAVSKHAALSLAEWIAVEHGDQGIKVSCVCPQGVRTRMLLGEDGGKESFLKAGSVSVEEVAEAAVRGLETEQFLILPHSAVRTYFERKADDYDRWLRGMRRLRQTAG